MVLTRPGFASSSASVIQRVETPASVAISSLSRFSIVRLVERDVAGVEIEPTLAVADRAAGHGVGQHDRQEMQRGMGAHALEAQFPVEPRTDGVADEGRGAPSAGTCTIVLRSAS